MNKFQKVVIGLGSGVGMVLAFVLPSFAQTPPVADATVSANTTALVQGLNNAGLGGLSTAIIAGGVLLVTAALVFWIIKHFRALVHI